MKLLIVESPSKAKTIGKYLGKEYKVVASVGHVRDLPKSNKNAIDIEGGFVPKYQTIPGKEKIISDIRSLAKKSDEILLATDPDREGEAIAWHLVEAGALKNPKRVLFHEITEGGIREALKMPRQIDENLRRAQEARRVLDRLVGYDLSGLIWKKVRYGLSAGRVQSPALHIIAEREREINAFVPETFWRISGTFLTGKKDSIDLLCSEEPRDRTRTDEILSVARSGNWEIVEVKETEVIRNPLPPFTTSTLQQTASSRLGFSPSRTMRVAQKLYEAGFITYMRTDSVALSEEALGHIATAVKSAFGDGAVQIRHFKTKSKNAQEAHEAIRPTSFGKLPHLTGDALHLYRLIRTRTIASQMKSAELLRTKVSANTTDRALPDFSVTGSHLVSAGWLAADPDARQGDIDLPKLHAGEPIGLGEIRDEEKATEPPKRYSEAGLVKELEKRGLGRPSTYASIIKTLLDRQYVEKEGRSLKATETGDVVDGFLSEHFPNVVSDSLTAEMENELDEIADGKREYTKTLADFYGPFSKEVKAKDKSAAKATHLGEADEAFKCPRCGAGMVIKLGRSGKFLSCSKYPECDGALTMEGKEIEGPKPTGEKCPDCGGDLVEREGRYGKFVSCSAYPKCKYIKKDESNQNGTGVKCPKCGKGEMVEKRGRFGFFYSCSNYPDCKNAIKAKPTGALCPTCGALMMEGTKTIPVRCSDKTCPNHNPHKSDEWKAKYAKRK
ncbi:MAG: type I DNA topoisomerase [Candidatus Moranbacteria bacterium]|nr:type I DNA topoisomerase [Candidatus Moranbacteria bacterium]